MDIKRKKTRQFLMRGVAIGGDAPVTVQTMTKVPTRDTDAVLRQIRQLHRAGCDIVRVAVLNREDARSLGRITSLSPMPVIADIHFSKELALETIRQGADGIRVNPGNIRNRADWALIARELRSRGTVLRIGANSGSISDDPKYAPLSHAEKLVESAMDAVRFFEKEGLEKIKISLKSSSVLETIDAYEKMSERTDWPLHVGVTATGTGDAAVVKASLGIGALLLRGIGDTIRVSLNDPPLREVRAGQAILQGLNLRRFGAEVIACPGCGRSQIDIFRLAKAVEKKVKALKKNIKVAVMGCIVNGPGEAREADIGIAGGKGTAIVFRGGKIIAKAKEKDIVTILMDEIRKI